MGCLLADLKTMKGNYSISFVMPAYNCADTISESVESILNGNFKKGDELIIVNDSSIDKTGQMISELVNKYSFIKVINNERNIGCPATRNVGIKTSANQLIFNLDSDDVLVPRSVNILKKMIAIARASR